MMYDKLIKEKVRELRKNGLSLGQIYEKTNVPKTTIRLWIKNIVLTKEQQNILKERTNKALQEGRVKVQNAKVEERRLREKNLFQKAEDSIRSVSNRELFVAGIALYWGEGFKNKHEHRLGFCNSDPTMIVFYIRWLYECLHVKREDMIVRVTLNESYRGKTKEIEEFWSTITKIPLTQFTKPFYQYSQWKKQYKEENYYGVLRIHVKNSLEYLWQMKGWIEGLKHAKIGNTVSAG